MPSKNAEPVVPEEQEEPQEPLKICRVCGETYEYALRIFHGRNGDPDRCQHDGRVSRMSSAGVVDTGRNSVEQGYIDKARHGGDLVVRDETGLLNRVSKKP